MPTPLERQPLCPSSKVSVNSSTQQADNAEITPSRSNKNQLARDPTYSNGTTSRTLAQRQSGNSSSIVDAHKTTNSSDRAKHQSGSSSNSSDSLKETTQSHSDSGTLCYTPSQSQSSTNTSQSVSSDESFKVEVSQRIRSLSDNALRQELEKRGDRPGPLTPGTRAVYEVRLARIESDPELVKFNKENDGKIEMGILKTYSVF